MGDIKVALLVNNGGVTSPRVFSAALLCPSPCRYGLAGPGTECERGSDSQPL
jgi:hypothetical protein